MRRIIPCFALVSMSLAACGDDPIKPGSLNVNWTHPSTSSCGDRLIETLKARAMKGTEIIAEASSSCPDADRSGTIPLSDLDPGTYRIEVEGLDQGGNGTYLGVIEKQSVKEGQVVETVDILLGQKPASVTVEWTLPGGKTCAGAGIEEIQVELIFSAKTTAISKATETVDCNTANVVFPDLEPNDDVAVVVNGLNAEGDAIAQESFEDVVLAAGEDLKRSVALQACPGTPPACP